MNLIRFTTVGFCLLLVFIISGAAFGVAPTQDAIAKWKADGTYEKKIADWKAFKELGGCSPSDHSLFNKIRIQSGMALGAAAVDSVNILVILVEFTDHLHTGSTYGQYPGVAASPGDFDSILFSNRDIDPVTNPTGSMTDFYLENSYGNFYVQGGVTNWELMPQTYAYYDGGANGIGSATSRSQQMVLSAIDAVNDSINFGDYDKNNDGVIDGLVIIHAGPGAETGEPIAIWSHKFHLAGSYGSVIRDGIILYDYTMNPEEGFGTISPIGVFCHEFGHSFGLPDLYDITDTTGTSNGLGRWSLMATGNYNGSGKRPAHFDAWCKGQIGFLTLTNVTANMNNVAIPAVEYNPVAFRLSNATSSPEYWVVENRRQQAFDINLPWNGLLIYHVDPNAPTVNGSNADPDRYLVGLEQADGLSQLNYTLNNQGDNGDPFPGSANNRAFHDLTNPSDEVYKVSGLFPNIGVWEISDSDSIMYADFDISWSRPYILNDSIWFDDALGNNDGNLDPGETISVYLIARNLMRTGFNARGNMAISNPDVNITVNNQVFAATFNSTAVNNNSAPLQFTLSNSIETQLDSFYLTISCDSTSGGVPGNANNYTRTFAFQIVLGTPEILIVDDDRGQTFDVTVKSVFSRNQIPTNVWHIQSQGVPSDVQLQKYPIVFWHTGDSAANVIDAVEISRMKTYMDAGKNLFLSTMSGVRDMYLLDSAFLKSYFKASYAGQTTPLSNTYGNAQGVTGSTLGNGSRYRPAIVTPFNHERQLLSLQSGGEIFLSHDPLNGPNPPCGITYSGTYKSVLISFPFEAIQDGAGGSFRPKDTLVNRVVKFFEGITTDIGDDPFSILPETFQLNQNYPNPFNPTTTISYTIHSRGLSKNPNRTLLEIYNLLGQKVKTLVDESQSPGSYSVDWDGTGVTGEKVASGIYFYRLRLGAESLTRKMLLVK